MRMTLRAKVEVEDEALVGEEAQETTGTEDPSLGIDVVIAPFGNGERDAEDVVGIGPSPMTMAPALEVRKIRNRDDEYIEYGILSTQYKVLNFDLQGEVSTGAAMIRDLEAVEGKVTSGVGEEVAEEAGVGSM